MRMVLIATVLLNSESLSASNEAGIFASDGERSSLQDREMISEVSMAADQRNPLRTEQVERLENELLVALREAVPASGVNRDRAAGLISSICCQIYNRAELLPRLAKPGRSSCRIDD